MTDSESETLDSITTGNEAPNEIAEADQHSEEPLSSANAEAQNSEELNSLANARPPSSVEIVVQRSKSNSGSSTSSMSVRCPTDDGGDSMTSSLTSSTRSDDLPLDMEENTAASHPDGDASAGHDGDNEDASSNRDELNQPKQKNRQQQRRLRDNGSSVLSPRSSRSSSNGSSQTTSTKDSRSNSLYLEITGREKTIQPQKNSASAAAATGTVPVSPSTTKSSSTAASETTSFESDEQAAIPFGKPEPKFEPRFSHYKANTVEGIKWDSMHFVEHRKKKKVPTATLR